MTRDPRPGLNRGGRGAPAPEFSGRDAGFVPVAMRPRLRSEAHLVLCHNLADVGQRRSCNAGILFALSVSCRGCS